MRHVHTNIETGDRFPFLISDPELLAKLFKFAKPVPKEQSTFRLLWIDGWITILDKCVIEIDLPTGTELHYLWINHHPVLLESKSEPGSLSAVAAYLIHPEIEGKWSLPESAVADAVRRRRIARGAQW